MRSLKLFAVFSLLLLASSCVSVGKLTTPSSKPEVTVHNASKKQVLDAIVAWSAMHGRQVTATTEYSITTLGQMDARTTNNLLWDETTLARTIYTPVVKGNDITIYSQRFITYTEETSTHDYNHGSRRGVEVNTAYEQTEEYNSQRAYEEMQIELENFAQFFAQNK